MPKSPNPDIINKIYFRNIYSCQRKIYWYKVKVMETINAVWEHSYGEDEFELSESQRFFIDIALRMAIVTFVCSKTTASTSMLIDTPEGSLDIAYETNAGSMFYEYIAANQKMIITANLNSSGLIQTLAGKTKFEIHKSTWLFRLLCGLIICLFKSNRRISMLDRETVERLLQNNLDAKLNSELSKYGYQLDAAHKLFRFITSIFERTPPELITWKFKVIMPVGDWDFSQKIILNFHRMNEVFTSECAFIIVDSNLYLIEPYEADYSGRDHICYQYNAPQNESLTIKDKQFQLSEYYDSAITSIFAQPTYKELDEAMDYYNTRYVRDSSCAVLSQIWTDEAKREFVQKPEHFMRDSLWQCLQNILRNHTVKREQIVDATHPVDIKVTWPAINNVALIEVKWLGDSGQTQYRDARANEGAKQLIDYLASSVQEEPDKHFVGYLTVFDGRRGKTSNQYERQEINYRSEYSSHPSMNYRRFYMAECV